MPEYVKRLRELVGPDEVLQLPAAAVALRHADGRVLLARHVEHGQWILPGGTIEPGEVPADAAVREMRKETGITVELTRLVGVFGGPDFLVRYRNGDYASYIVAVFEATATDHAGEPHPSELLKLRFMSAEECARAPLAPWMPIV